MKKLKLKFDDAKMLSKEQMRNIQGGEYTGWYCWCENGPNEGSYTICNGEQHDCGFWAALVFCQNSTAECTGIY